MKRFETTKKAGWHFLRNKPVGLVLLVSLLFVIPDSYAQVSVPYTSHGTYTFTVPAGVTSVTVECWGAGGAGGGATSNGYYGGAGGAGGAYASKVITVTPGNNYTVTVGQGGNGGTGNGPSGGDSWFKNTSTVIAKGGAGGGNNNGSPGTGTTSGSIGTTVYQGGDGGSPYYYSYWGIYASGAGGGGAGPQEMVALFGIGPRHPVEAEHPQVAVTVRMGCPIRPEMVITDLQPAEVVVALIPQVVPTVRVVMVLTGR